MPWSMIWWKGKLYVGTGRSTQCVQVATEAIYLWYITYPPLEPDIECTPDPLDLPLQAEIWRWTPETNVWDRIYQSPNDVPVPGHPGKFVPRDIGYRGMILYTEPDGTEALYISGVSARSFIDGLPPPRLLRSTDGEHFTPLPQNPGTFLGDIAADGFRSLAVYKGRLYVHAAVGFLGHGPLLEAADPAGGNNNFRQVSPEGVNVYEIKPFNGFLYIGTASKTDPFTVLKTDGEGSLPYTFTPVIEQGGYRLLRRASAVTCLHVFNNRLYVGTDMPSELYAINPDDTWDLIVGRPRMTSSGWKPSKSGLGTGFDWFLNIHMWRMATYNDQLFVGTMDQSTHWRTMPFAGRIFGDNFGFDLYSSVDGVHFSMISKDGFGDQFNVGVRNLMPTPYGLFMGSANHFYGMNIWKTAANPAPLGEGVVASRAYLPLMSQAAGTTGTLADPQAPTWLALESYKGGVLLSWPRPPNAARFHIYRSDFVAEPALAAQDEEGAALIPGAFDEIGAADEPFFVDATAQPGKRYHYYVRAENAAGAVSSASPLARAPAFAKPVTFASIKDALAAWGRAPRSAAPDAIEAALARAEALVGISDSSDVVRRLTALQQQLRTDPAPLEAWRAHDLEHMLAELAVRTELVQHNMIAPTALLR
jgi:hypothetical protein